MFTRDFWMAVLVRAIRTFAEGALAYIGTGAVVLGDVNWIAVASAGCMAAVVSVLMSVATGIPEADKHPVLDE